jgi:hypothetical protein
MHQLTRHVPELIYVQPPAVFGRRNTPHFAAGTRPYLLLPVIPAA